VPASAWSGRPSLHDLRKRREQLVIALAVDAHGTGWVRRSEGLIDQHVGMLRKDSPWAAGVDGTRVVPDYIRPYDAMGIADRRNHGQEIGQAHAALVPVRDGIVTNENILVDRQIDVFGLYPRQQVRDEIIFPKGSDVFSILCSRVPAYGRPPEP